MAITKTNFINYTRCRRYCALENIRKDKLDSKMTIEEYMKENEKEEYRELLESMFESTDDGDTDLTKKEDKEVSNQEKLITPNTKIIIKTYYKDCNHIIEESAALEDEWINLNEEELNYIFEVSDKLFDRLTK